MRIVHLKEFVTMIELESNIKLIKSRKHLKLQTSIVTLDAQGLNIDELNKVCSQLSYRHGIPATPFSLTPSCQILIRSEYHLNGIEVLLKNKMTDLKVTFKPQRQPLLLAFKNPDHRRFLASLFKAALLINVRQSKRYWTYDSPRIFYQKEAFMLGGKERGRDLKDISAYRRFEISEVILEDAVGISVDVGTGFFTNRSVNEYHRDHTSKARFKRLSSRQDEQKGTLMYKNPTGGYSKCYFLKFPSTVTCANTNSFERDGIAYENLLEYYRIQNPKYKVTGDDKVAFVSFPGLSDSQPVAAKMLRVRVMNDMLSSDLSQVDKIKPDERNRLINGFWSLLGKQPFGENFPGLEFGGRNYKPGHKAGLLSLPDLQFKGGHTLYTPNKKSVRDYKENFNTRRTALLNHGCFYKPFMITRQIHFVHPEKVDQQIARDFAEQVCSLSSSLTGIDITPIIENYRDYKEMLVKLGQEDPSMVVFIFDKHEPAAYYGIRYRLEEWDVKRVTSRQLLKKHTQGKGQWNSFIELNTFDILQQLGCVLWSCPPLGFDMHLAIDVSDQFSHFCFSPYFFNENMDKPIIKTDSFPKTNRQEKINKRILEIKLGDLFDEWSNELIQYKPKNMLIIRDGKVCEGELEGLKNVIESQIKKKHLPPDFQFDLIEYHKATQKGIRLWTHERTVHNVLEGTYFKLDGKRALLCSTGHTTLNQGTAKPTLIKSVFGERSIEFILQDLFSLSQLNYSSPRVAQNYCLPIKRADEQLRDRKLQEVARIK